MQVDADGSPATRAQARTHDKLVPPTPAARLEPTAYNPELGLLYIPSIEGMRLSATTVDSGLRSPIRAAPANPRTFSGGGTKIKSASTASLKAVDSITGDIIPLSKLVILDRTNKRALRPGKLVFHLQSRRDLLPHDFAHPAELWLQQTAPGQHTVRGPPIT